MEMVSMMDERVEEMLRPANWHSSLIYLRVSEETLPDTLIPSIK